MTIGVGFTCSDGIVLCSDRQISGEDFKFEARKIYKYYSKEFSFIFSYAGDPDAAKLLFGRLEDELEAGIAKSKAKAVNRKILASLGTIFKDRHAKNLLTLIGVWASESDWHMFKTKAHQVVNAQIEYIGLGDSSALRYLTSFLLDTQLRVNEAEIVASYIVFVANRFVRGCSGGPDVTILYKDGGVGESLGVMPRQRQIFLHYEEEMGKHLREMLVGGIARAVVS